MSQLGSQHGQKEEYLTLLPIVQDKGRNTPRLGAVLQSCSLSHSGDTHFSGPAPSASSDTVARGGNWGAVNGTAGGSPARSNPWPILSPHSEDGLAGSWRDFSLGGNFCSVYSPVELLLQAAGPVSPVLDKILLRELDCPPFLNGGSSSKV